MMPGDDARDATRAATGCCLAAGIALSLVCTAETLLVLSIAYAWVSRLSRARNARAAAVDRSVHGVFSVVVVKGLHDGLAVLGHSPYR